MRRDRLCRQDVDDDLQLEDRRAREERNPWHNTFALFQTRARQSPWTAQPAPPSYQYQVAAVNAARAASQCGRRFSWQRRPCRVPSGVSSLELRQFECLLVDRALSVQTSGTCCLSTSLLERGAACSTRASAPRLAGSAPSSCAVASASVGDPAVKGTCVPRPSRVPPGHPSSSLMRSRRPAMGAATT